MKVYLLFSLIVFSFQRDDIYMCHDDAFIDEQCMKKEKIGSNTFYWLRKCKGSKVCVDLPYYGGITGSCIIKVRSHYDGESCANGNKCTSGVCDGTKCIGKDQGLQCEPGLGQCKKGLLCRKVSSTSSIYTCEAPVQPGQKCGKLGGYNPNVDTIYGPLLDPANNVCTLGYTCDILESDNGICVRIGSMTVTTGTSVNNPLACETGLTDGGCSTTGRTGLKTSKGLDFSNYANATRHFNAWLDASTYDDDTEDEDAIYEAYRYTRNKKKINELWFRYIKSHRVDDADECAYDYFWKQSSSNYIQLSFLILTLTLLF